METEFAAGGVSARSGWRRGLRVVDAVVGWGLYAAAVVLGLNVGYIVMVALVSDPCPTTDRCSQDAVGWGIGICWGGTIVALTGCAVMLVRAMVRRGRLWWWPIAAVLAILASTAGGLAVAGLSSR